MPRSVWVILFGQEAPGPRIELVALGKQFLELRLPIVNFQRMQGGFVGEAGFLGGRFHIQQQGFEFGGPLLLLLFCQEGQLAQQMHETESMRTGIQEVGVPAIMDAGSRKPWQDADGIQGDFASLGMNRVMGELGGTGHMHPVPQAVDVEARFILMEDVGFHQRFLDLLLDLNQVPATALDQARQRAFAHLDLQQVREHFTGSAPGQELLLHQVDRHGSHPRPVLDRGIHPGWEKGGCELLAVGALLALSLMLLHDQLRHWHIHHLPTFDLQRGYGLQIRLAVLTAGDGMHEHLIGTGTPHQRLAWVAWLSTRFLPALLVQALGLPNEAVRGGRQMRIVAVFRQPLFQQLHTLLQLRDQFISLGQLLTQHAILLFQLTKSFF